MAAKKAAEGFFVLFPLIFLLRTDFLKDGAYDVDF